MRETKQPQLLLPQRRSSPLQQRAAGHDKGAATGSASWLAALAAATTDGLVLVGNDRRVRHGLIRVRKHR
jgi:hypothetical protein